MVVCDNLRSKVDCGGSKNRTLEILAEGWLPRLEIFFVLLVFLVDAGAKPFVGTVGNTG